MADWLVAIGTIAGLMGGAIVAIFTLGQRVKGIQVQAAENSRDLNGLGRKFAKELTFKIRELAAECTDNVLKEKLSALADLTEPK
jgi:hypothetical protein